MQQQSDYFQFPDTYEESAKEILHFVCRRWSSHVQKDHCRGALGASCILSDGRDRCCKTVSSFLAIAERSASCRSQQLPGKSKRTAESHSGCYCDFLVAQTMDIQEGVSYSELAYHNLNAHRWLKKDEWTEKRGEDSLFDAARRYESRKVQNGLMTERPWRG